ncbi:hypothetical protein [Chromobacterium sp. IIBBL 290-4]|nr:hypothetical protein [Chromobacterium sp. IIBBL 290-4]
MASEVVMKRPAWLYGAGLLPFIGILIVLAFDLILLLLQYRGG